MPPFHVPRNSEEDSVTPGNLGLSTVVLKVIILLKNIEATVQKIFSGIQYEVTYKQMFQISNKEGLGLLSP